MLRLSNLHEKSDTSGNSSRLCFYLLRLKKLLADNSGLCSNNSNDNAIYNRRTRHNDFFIGQQDFGLPNRGLSDEFSEADYQ